MKKQNIFWIEGFSSPPTKKITDEVIEKIEQVIERKIEKIEYIKFPKKNMKKLKKAIGIKEYAKEIIRVFPNNPNEYPIIIGCSMGGLVARFLIEKMNLKVKGLILLATPNKGINLSLTEKVFLKIIGPVPCIEDMRPESDFLKSLGKSPLEEDYYFFGGINDARVSVDSSLPTKGPRSVLINAGHSEMVNIEAIIKLASIIKVLILASNQSLQV